MASSTSTVLSMLIAPLLSFTCLLLLLSCSAALLWRPKHRNGQKLPPGPKALPIIGNLHMLGTSPHRTLYNLAQKYGDIMSLKLGQEPAIVVSSPQAAELFLKTHDAVFASRPKMQASEIMQYGTKAMALTKYGSYWRNVRKFCNMHLLSGSKIGMSASMRREEVGLLVEEIKKSVAAREVVDLSKKVSGVVEDMTCRMVFGRSKDDEFDLKALIEEGVCLAGAFNLSDYVPFLAPLDLQGFAKRMKAVSKSIDKVFEKIIFEHENDATEKQKQHKDFVDVLLSMLNQPMNPNDEPVYVIDRTNIKAIMIDMVSGSFDTSSTVIDWTLSELLRHPRVMARLQEELECIIGKKRVVEEIDLVKLPYLDMVIKETLRLHPVSPLLIPHESMEDITINGYYIPKKSKILVNVWAIGHDPNVWSNNVNEFLPERFIDSSLDVKGHNFELIPFGSGRRGCPGMQLGLIVVKLMVAQLVHCFDWKLPSGMLPNEIDMSEHFGLAVSREKHLFAIPTYRLHV